MIIKKFQNCHHSNAGPYDQSINKIGDETTNCWTQINCDNPDQLVHISFKTFDVGMEPNITTGTCRCVLDSSPNKIFEERVILWAINTAQFFGKVSLQKGNCMKAYAHTVKMDDTCFLKSISCRYFLSVSL